MLEEGIVPECLLLGKRRKLYWVLTRGAGIFSMVLLFYYYLPDFVGLLDLAQLSESNRLLATSIFASTLLTFALVAVYRDLGETQVQQAEIMEGQRDLRRKQLNRNVREKHTEILRHRIEEWLGETPAASMWDDDSFGAQNTLPTVGATGVTSAAKEVSTLDDDSFFAAPVWLEDEQYFEDLLRNHAPELEELKHKIEELQTEFVTKRDNFIAQVESGPTKETSEYKIKPATNYPQWVFEQVVLMERRDHSQEDLSERASTVVDVTAMATGDSTVYPGEDFYGSPTAVYEAKAKTGDRQILSEYRNEIETGIIELLRASLEDIDDGEPYNLAREAATTLDKMDKAVSNLRFKLTEYQGLPFFPGECEYLEEEMLDK